jgi:hypothetical protein
MSEDDRRAELERLRQENAALKKGAAKGVSLKVSEKGGLSVYGLGRFPVTLYKEQWAKLLDMSEEIRSFIAAHDKELKTKEQRVSLSVVRTVARRPREATLPGSRDRYVQ